MTEFDVNYLSDLNEPLGGTLQVELGDQQYRFPRELSGDKVMQILDDEVSDDHQLRNNGDPYFYLELGNGKQVNFLTPRGSSSKVKGVGLYDREDGGWIEFYKVDDLLDE